MSGNGSLSLADLTKIHHPRGIPVYLRRDAAASWEDMRRASLSRHGVDLYPLGGASACRTYRQQVELKRQWTAAGEPQKAAVPGTSNRGWGVAVDLGDGRSKDVSQQMWAVLRQIGPNYGWSWDEGRRVGEDWHFRYVGGYRPDPLQFFTDREKRLVRELLALRRLDHPTPAQVRRRGVVWRWLREQRKRIYHEAQKTGWDRAHRRRRYQLLRGLTHV
ncbi:MAG TPA: D-alanyl-D-alanine carboxypeptidase family protein [Baekduia sp.]|uniref:D-alanyl-D-alanine carboxypeptidase family protein n=1 Tax=Baekduia sp. TaxID=2600305 RepID=UPI002C2C6BA9|nr:D-alanyl-D-alanine carboxypeptidase family protein [Baekduia sp.]HMJ32971.1 D-alanyl-D-alanine carboxypeptidase family protein [Baekduia sp.]